jgi:uncharacterized integral membrane protein (TIGR00697 family)
MNELYYFLMVLVDLSLALVAFRLGRYWLIGFIVGNLLLVTPLAGKVVEIFGFATTVAGPFYASIFLATDVLTEHFGKKYGHLSVMVGFFALALFVGLSQISLMIDPIKDSVELHQGMVLVFGTSLRVFAASIIAYIISQNWDVWFYHFLMQKTKGRFLWLRNNVSTVTSQVIDSMIFFSIAFYGVIPNWLEVAIVGCIAKIVVALLDTPFIYLSKKVKTIDKM